MMFVIGILTWQAVATIVYFVTGENEEKCAAYGCGLFILILSLVQVLVNKIQLHNSRKYNLYQFFGSHETGNLSGWVGNYYMTEKDAKRFNLLDRDATPEPYSVRLLREGREFKSVPNCWDILTTKKIENGICGMTKDFIAKFFKKEEV